MLINWLLSSSSPGTVIPVSGVNVVRISVRGGDEDKYGGSRHSAVSPSARSPSQVSQLQQPIRLETRSSSESSLAFRCKETPRSPDGLLHQNSLGQDLLLRAC